MVVKILFVTTRVVQVESRISKLLLGSKRMVLSNMVCHSDDCLSLPVFRVAIDDFVAVQSNTTNDKDSAGNVMNDTRFYPFTVVWGGVPCRIYPKEEWSGPVCGVGHKRNQTKRANTANFDILQCDLADVGNVSPEEIDPNRILGKVAYGPNHRGELNPYPLCVFRYGSAISLDLADFESDTEVGPPITKACRLKGDVVKEVDDASTAASHFDQLVSVSTRASPLWCSGEGTEGVITFSFDEVVGHIRSRLLSVLIRT